MEEDHKKSQTRAQEDMQKLADYFTKDFAQVQADFLEDLASLPEGMSGATYKAVKAVLEAEAKAIGDAGAQAAETARENHRANGGVGGMPYESEGETGFSGGGLLDRAVGHRVSTPVNGWRMRTNPATGRSGFHTGVDYSAAAGTPVYAPFDGVMSVGNFSPAWAGNSVVIKPTSGGLGVGYAHLRGVSRGPGQVRKGEKVGAVGSTGNSTGPHLHIEVLESPYKLYSDAVNPYPHLAKGGIVTDDIMARIGEGGFHEAVIPLNRDGAQVMAETMVRYLQSGDALRARVSQFSSPVTNNVYSYDQRTQFTGAVTVQSQNPDDMARRLAAKARAQRLGRKVGSAA
jgi:murein DD-endopeptidase MepM/ murein hydrolase activator NlpD